MSNVRYNKLLLVYLSIVKSLHRNCKEFWIIITRQLVKIIVTDDAEIWTY